MVSESTSIGVDGTNASTEKGKADFFIKTYFTAGFILLEGGTTDAIDASADASDITKIYAFENDGQGKALKSTPIDQIIGKLDTSTKTNQAKLLAEQTSYVAHLGDVTTFLSDQKKAGFLLVQGGRTPGAAGNIDSNADDTEVIYSFVNDGNGNPTGSSVAQIKGILP